MKLFLCALFPSIQRTLTALLVQNQLDSNHSTLWAKKNKQKWNKAGQTNSTLSMFNNLSKEREQDLEYVSFIEEWGVEIHKTCDSTLLALNGRRAESETSKLQGEHSPDSSILRHNCQVNEIFFFFSCLTCVTASADCRSCKRPCVRALF